MKSFTCTYIHIAGLVMTSEKSLPYAITVGIVDDFGTVIPILETNNQSASVAIANFE